MRSKTRRTNSRSPRATRVTGAQALEDFVRAVLARPEPDRPAPHEPWSMPDRALMVSIGEKVCADYERRA